MRGAVEWKDWRWHHEPSIILLWIFSDLCAVCGRRSGSSTFLRFVNHEFRHTAADRRVPTGEHRVMKKKTSDQKIW